MTLSKQESEADVRYRVIDPMIRECWDADRVLLERPISNGKISPEGRGGKRNTDTIKKPDYVLEYAPNVPLCVVEAKSKYIDAVEGIPQAKKYAKALNVKFAYATNGKEIKEYDDITKQQKTVEKIPCPEDLWNRLNHSLQFSETQKNNYLIPLNKESDTPDGKIMEPRYYQQTAINIAMENILSGNKRMLLTLATGTGKTFIAFQIAWKLWKADPDVKILFLVDRDALLKQAYDKDFRHFGDARHRIQKKPNEARTMYFALYQALDADQSEGELYKQYDKDFFDYVIVDECHRGVSSEESSWREILEYFNDSTHIGMTATPSRKNEVDDTYRWFRKPLYEYSLRDGIEDGFLAPFVVDRQILDIDEIGYKPKEGEIDINGNPLTKDRYFRDDFDRIITVKSRQEAVADYVINHLNKTGKFDKTIVFCQNSKHAAEMTELLNNKAKEDGEYCVRIVSKDLNIGKEFLEDFSNPKEKLPVIAVTSRLMSTGIDAPTCRNIVLDKTLHSMIEFKQIIGRGTRVYELDDKFWFTIIDFRNTTVLFDDPDWDGPAEPPPKPLKGESREGKPREIKPHLVVDGNPVNIVGRYVTIYDPAAERGKRLITYEEFTGNSVKRLESDFGDELRQIWIDVKKRAKFVEELEKRGITIIHIRQLMENYDADVFDILYHLAHGGKIKTRKERIESVRHKKLFLEKYPEKAREVLTVIMNVYAEQGYQELDPEDPKLLKLSEFEEFGGDYTITHEIFENPQQYRNAIRDLLRELYET